MLSGMAKNHLDASRADTQTLAKPQEWPRDGEIDYVASQPKMVSDIQGMSSPCSYHLVCTSAGIRRPGVYLPRFPRVPGMFYLPDEAIPSLQK